jgi:hypothetical protein
VNSTSAIATQAVAHKNISRANANKHPRALAARIKGTLPTPARSAACSASKTRRTPPTWPPPNPLAGVDQTGGVVELAFDKSIRDGMNMNPESFRGYAKRDGDADFILLPRDTA